MNRRSLSFRIVVSSLSWMVLTLLITGWVLTRLYQGHVERHFDAHLTMHVEELLASLHADEDGEFRLQRPLVDPRFNQPGSGWYWSISRDGQPLIQSASLAGHQLRTTEPMLLDEDRVQALQGPSGQPLRGKVVYIAADSGPGSIGVAVTAPQMQIRDDVKDYTFHIAQSLLVLGLGLSMAILAQVRLALRPFEAIQKALGEIRSGARRRLPEDFPRDVQVLADEVNALVDHNETLVKRARNQLADLAHVVKNPLAVIRNEARQLPGGGGQLILDQSYAMSRSIDNCLSRARVYGRKDALGFRTGVSTVVDDLCFALRHIYRDRHLEIVQGCGMDQQFRGEVEDLEEMLGNLLDNACKWASTRVEINCARDNGQLVVRVEDDGPGVPIQQRDAVLQRGRKLDDSRPGDGQGLGIVRDIAEIYGGKLELCDSHLGGLCACLLLPAA